MAANPLPIVDGHNDTLARLERSGASFLPRSPEGSVDYSRAVGLGFGGGFFAIFAPEPLWANGDIAMTVGFDEASLRAITPENWIRVLRATWR